MCRDVQIGGNWSARSEGDLPGSDSRYGRKDGGRSSIKIDSQYFLRGLAHGEEITSECTEGIRSKNNRADRTESTGNFGNRKAWIPLVPPRKSAALQRMARMPVNLSRLPTNRVPWGQLRVCNAN
jgi:hypothetical protein